jgi:hypothetical protein
VLPHLKKNPRTLRHREAKYAGNAPLGLLNQIDDHRQAIALTEQVLIGSVPWRLTHQIVSEASRCSFTQGPDEAKVLSPVLKQRRDQR